MQKISKDNIIYAMCASNAPVMRVQPMSQVCFEVVDAFGGQITSEDAKFDGLDWSRINPATGPVYVETADVGDILSVRIDRIDVAQSGAVVCGKGMGVMGHVLEKNYIKIIEIKSDIAIFSDEIHMPINKMIGVIGVAPAGDAVPCGVPCLHGGNMDCKEIREGATVLLPVNVPGALLAMGDLHAVMADGEVGISGLEVSGLVTVTIDVIKGKNWPLPMIVNDSHVMTLASHADLDVAVEMAVENMVDYMQSLGFDKYDAVMLCSLAGDVQICQVVDPKKTARVSISHNVLQMRPL